MLLTFRRPDGPTPWRDRVYQAALFAMHEEPAVWPRFGLVGPGCTGSHLDMDYPLLRRGAEPVARYAATAFEQGWGTLGTLQDFRQLRQLGMLAEQNMLVATGGVNTHKGCIFLLGLLSFALGHSLRLGSGVSFASLFAQVSAHSHLELVKDLTAKHHRCEESYGEWAFRRYGFLGVRGVAIGGFADLYNALSWLSDQGDKPMKLLYGQLRLFFLARCEDTNIVKRVGLSKALDFRHHAARAMKSGGIFSGAGLLKTQRLEGWMQKLRCSAAASGDMIILVMFFERLRQYGFFNWQGHPGCA